MTRHFFMFAVVNFVSTNGWFITFGLIGLYVLYTKFESYFQSWRPRPQQPQYHGNPETLIQRQEAMEVARRRMQERQDALAEQQKVKQKELEERKRQEKINNWDQLQQGRGLGSKLGTSPREEEVAQPSGLSKRSKGSSSERLRGTDFNPLMGSAGGSSYRPERRCTSQGG